MKTFDEAKTELEERFPEYFKNIGKTIYDYLDLKNFKPGEVSPAGSWPQYKIRGSVPELLQPAFMKFIEEHSNSK